MNFIKSILSKISVFFTNPRLEDDPFLKSITSSPNQVNVDVVQQVMAKMLIDDLIQERRNERKWKWAKRFTFSFISVILFGMYLFFYASNLGYKIVPSSDIMGMVRIEGEITDSSNASADKIIPALKDAFEQSNVKAVLLYINSPGGQPAESERINNYIDQMKIKTKKPVYAVISNTGASAAYLIAIHADKIYAGKYSMVGSIGAVMAAWDFHKIAEKVDVSQNVFVSGRLKHMMDPYRSMTPEEQEKAQSLVSTMGSGFLAEVKELRKATLKKDFDYGTGEIWTGQQALSLGLIDGISTAEKLAKEKYSVDIYDFGPRKKTPNPFLSMKEYVSDALKMFINETITTPIVN